MSQVRNFEKEAKYLVLIFYGVGVIGMLTEISRPFFLQLIPFALLLSTGVLTLFYQGRRNVGTILVFVLIFFLGLLVEIIGVNTGVVFGQYEYGSSLGIKVFGTPLSIGLNWLLLVYMSSSIIEHLNISDFLKISISASVMLIYDVFLELVAPGIDFWFWHKADVPVQNYVAWFILAFLFNALIKLFRIKTSNPLSLVVLGSQFLMFVILSIFLT